MPSFQRIRIALLTLCVCLPSAQASKPFKRALILTGGNLNASLRLGVLEAARRSGQAPDLLIGVCGGSIAAAVAHAFPESSDAHAFMRSEEMHSFARSFRASSEGSASGFSRILAMVKMANFFGLLPDYFTPAIFKITQPFPKAFESAFRTDRIATIIVATRTRFRPKDVGSLILWRKLFEETYFTDVETARYLEGARSEIAQRYPDSSVTARTRVETQWTLAEAVRASIADPFLLPPFEKDGQTYMAGSHNLYPVELARELADEVILTAPEAFGEVENLVFESTFGLSDAERLKDLAKSKRVDHWVDFTRIGSELFQVKPDLKFPFWFTDSLVKLSTNVPSALSDYQEMIDTQYATGSRRANESFQQPRFSLEHVRNKFAP